MRKTWILIGICMLLFTIFEIISTYAKYTTQATATTDMQAGAWVIKVNSDTISTVGQQQATFDIDDLIYPSNEYVVDDKLAPSSSGYFDIEIDATGSSVAVRFDVSLNTDNLDNFDAIRFTDAFRVINGVEVTGGMVRTADKTYSGIISLSDIEDEEASKVRFYVGWDEEDTEAGDISDSQIGMTPGVSTDLTVTVVATQYLGETLVPYVVSTS